MPPVKKKSSTNESQWIFTFNGLTNAGVAIGLLAFLSMAIIAFRTPNHFDEQVFRAIPHNSTGFTSFMRSVTKLGNTEVLVMANFLLIVFLIINRERKTAMEVLVVAVSSLFLMSFLKRSFHRVRPPLPLVEGITNYSFPSGHAFMSVAFYCLMMWWATIHIKEKWLQRAVISFFVFVILLIGFSRVYLRVHYTTDVIAGFGMGLAWFIISLAITDKFIKGSPSGRRH